MDTTAAVHARVPVRPSGKRCVTVSGSGSALAPVRPQGHQRSAGPLSKRHTVAMDMIRQMELGKEVEVRKHSEALEKSGASAEYSIEARKDDDSDCRREYSDREFSKDFQATSMLGYFASKARAAAVADLWQVYMLRRCGWCISTELKKSTGSGKLPAIAYDIIAQYFDPNLHKKWPVSVPSESGLETLRSLLNRANKLSL